MPNPTLPVTKVNALEADPGLTYIELRSTFRFLNAEDKAAFITYLAIAGGGGTWGTITGTLSEQTDLNSALGAKAPLANPTFTGKVQLTPTTTAAGINLGALVTVPSSPVNGDLWVNSSNNTLHCRIAGVTQTLANLNSPVFTGTPSCPTFAFSTDSSVLATTAFVWDHMPAQVVVPTEASRLALDSPTIKVGDVIHRQNVTAGTAKVVTLNFGSFTVDGSYATGSLGSDITIQAYDFGPISFTSFYVDYSSSGTPDEGIMVSGSLGGSVLITLGNDNSGTPNGSALALDVASALAAAFGTVSFTDISSGANSIGAYASGDLSGGTYKMANPGGAGNYFTVVDGSVTGHNFYFSSFDETGPGGDEYAVGITSGGSGTDIAIALQAAAAPYSGTTEYTVSRSGAIVTFTCTATGARTNATGTGMQDAGPANSGGAAPSGAAAWYLVCGTTLQGGTVKMSVITTPT